MQIKPPKQKNILLEFYGTDRYSYRLVEEKCFDINKMDSMWKEEFGVDIITDPRGSWEWTDCEVEPLFEISCLGGGWHWGVKKRLWLNNQFKVIYIEEGTTKGIEDALMSAMSKFEEVLTEGYTQEELDKMLEEVTNDESVSDRDTV